MDKPIGQRGTWFAEFDGERLPCVHDYWWKNGKYHDPYGRPDEQRWIELRDALALGKAILQKDRLREDVTDMHRFDRVGYIALFVVDNVQLDQDGLRFDFLKRLRSFK